MAGTIVETLSGYGDGIQVIELACTADAGDGTFPSTAIAYKFAGELLALETNPGATAPTANYDIAITDQHGHDVLQGVGANRHTSTTEKVPIVFSGTSIHPPIAKADTLTVAITNNAVNSATIAVRLYLRGYRRLPTAES